MAFAKYYWDETGRALHSGDTSVLKTLATNCVPCDEYVRSVDADAEKGLHADINPTVVGDHKVSDNANGKSDQVVTLMVTEKAYRVVDDQGEPRAAADAVNYDILIYLDESSSGWTVVDLYMLT